MTWVTTTPDWAAFLSVGRCAGRSLIQTVTSTAREADMRQTRYPIGKAVWMAAGIIVLMAFGDALILLALAFAIVATTKAWWIHHQVERSVEINEWLRSPIFVRL
jgi:hypothetical protein